MKAGSPCPNNPYHRHAELFDELSESASLIEMARYFSDLSEIGCVDVNVTLPEEWTLIRIMLAEKKREQYKAMHAGMMGMFGGKPKSQEQ